MAVVGGLSTFKGGHRFGRFQGRPKPGIKELPLPKKVLIPLRQRGFVRGDHQQHWAEPRCTVKVGDLVKTGQVIARDDEGLCSPVHASVSGKVLAVEQRDYPFGGQSQTVVIQSDGADTWVDLDSHAAEDYTQLDPEELGRILYETGVADYGLAGFPTAFHSSPSDPGSVKYLVINAVDTEPYVEGNDALLGEEFDKFVTGVTLLRSALGGALVHVGIGYNRAGLIEELQERIPQEWCFVHPLLPKYPQSENDVLVRTLLELNVPSGGWAGDVGAVVCDPQQAVAAYEAVIEGKPVVERVVTVAGSAIQGPANVRVRIGAPLSGLVRLKQAGTTVLGGVMRGVAVDDLQRVSVLRNTEAIVSLKQPSKALNMMSELGLRRDSQTNVYLNFPGLARIADVGLHGLERACVHCGYCFDVCPQNLAPITIADFARTEKLEDAQELDMNACIECGLCTYVCPSKIPVMGLIQDGKRAALEEV